MGLAIGTFIAHLEENLRTTLDWHTQTWKNPGAVHALKDMSANIEQILYGKKPPYPLGDYEHLMPRKKSQQAFNESFSLAVEALRRGMKELSTIDSDIAAKRMKNAITYLKEGIPIMESPWFQRLFRPHDHPLKPARDTLLKVLDVDIDNQLRPDDPGFDAARGIKLIEERLRSTREDRGREL